MEEHNKLDYDSDIIICEEIPETISVCTSPELRKPKAKKLKRRVKKSINFNNNMETLLITQKVKVKKTKFKCVININTVCEKRSESIVRFNSNVCKKEAYYHRIVPSCLREMCSGDAANCCRSTISRDYNKYCPRAGSLSPVSSLSLSEVEEVFSCDNISYEDVSNGSFSSASEELDTLIKRTRQREKQIDNVHSARKYSTSTPMFKDDIASPFSIDMDKKSIHSDNTLILNPLPTGAYSPTSLDVFKIDNTKDMVDMDIPYSPTMTPDLIKIENMDYSPVDRRDDHVPYSPSYTPETIEVEMEYNFNRNPTSLDDDLPYSPTFTPDIIEMEDSGDAKYGHDTNEPYSPTMTPDMIKMGTIDRANLNKNVNVGYSPRSPTGTTDLHRFCITQTDNSNHNTLYLPGIKQENLEESTTIRNTAPEFAILTPELIKKENKNTHEQRCNETDYNINNTMHCKTEKDDHQRGDNQADPSEITVKIEKDDRTNVNHVYSS